MESIKDTCKRLKRRIHPEEDNPCYILDNVYSSIHDMHEQEKVPNTASKEEFMQKVKSYPQEKFISEVKDIVNTREPSNWIPIVVNDMFISSTTTPNTENMYATEGSIRASVRAWNTTFKGDAATALFNTISDLLNPKVVAYARSTCIINSSGTGKSRMVDELSMSIITLPMCLRSHGSRGFPPPDIHLRDYFEEIRMLSDQGRVRQALHGIVYGILTVTLAHLLSIKCDITLPTKSETDSAYVNQVIRRQQELASSFRSFMTMGQSFGKVNENRQKFYGEVINAARAVKFSLLHHYCALTYPFKFNSHCKVGSEITTGSPAPYVDQTGKGVRSAAKALHDFVDPRGLVKYGQWRRPLVVLSFDESHVLTDGAKESEWSTFSELRRILQRLGGHLIFSLFLSTSGNFRMLSPDIKPDPSSRVVNEALLPFHPITEVSFDCLARPAAEGSMTLFEVTQIDWIAHLGRPLFGSHFDGLPAEDREGEIINFAKQKLLNSKEFLDKADISGSLACLATRFGLEFNEDEDSRDVSYKQVERHMRVCIAATTGFKNMITCSSSEPLLAEAAFHLMLNTESNPVKYLANHANLYCVDRGRRGELVAALIIMQARDASLPANLLQRRWVSVTDFIKALLPPQASEKFLRRYPTRWRKEEGKIRFHEAFNDCCLWFNHTLKVEDSDVINPKFLWKYVTRGAMIVCKDNQQGIDIILPMVWPNGNISRRTVSAIVIQVKNSKDFGFTVNNKLFDAMDPCGLGFLSDAPLPVIRMVFALASPKSGINFPAERSREIRHDDDFTAYDIWCAGLSTESFQQIGHDLESYQKLLGRSQQSHDAFDVAEPQNPLSEETKIIVGKTRRSMAPLVRFHGHDEIHGST